MEAVKMQYEVINKGDGKPIACFYNSGDAETFCRMVPNTEWVDLNFKDTGCFYGFIDASAYYRPMNAKPDLVVGGTTYRQYSKELEVM